jgi:rare lipoprotein A
MRLSYLSFGSLFFLFSSLLLQEALEKGKASYYSSKFEGRRTASGEVFKQDSLTAAHKTLPFGTRIKVTNLNNDSTVIVKVNDRLSKSSAHIIDLSLKAAKQLNFVRQGITTVTIEKITAN